MGTQRVGRRVNRLAVATLLVCAAIAAQLMFEIAQWLYALRSPNLIYQDFLSMYSAGRIARSLAFGQLYDLASQQQFQIGVIGKPYGVLGGVLPFMHPPFLIPLLAAVCDADYVASYARWSAVLAGAATGCAYFAGRLCRDRGWARGPVFVITASSAVFFPISQSIGRGQDSAFVLLGVIVWAWAMVQKRDRLAGAALALVMLRPHIAIFLAVPLLLVRRRAWWWFCAAQRPARVGQPGTGRLARRARLHEHIVAGRLRSRIRHE